MSEILIIGGGPGGYVAAIRAAQLGGSVKLVTNGSLGGVCLNVGCIPTKTLLETAHRFSDAKNAGEFGVNTGEVTLDVKKMQARRVKVIKQMVAGVGGLMKANGVEVISGTAVFTGKKDISIELEGGETLNLRPDKIIIATGSRPATPPIPGIDAAQCINSTAALALDEIPKSMIVIGGGVIGVEIATIYATLGTKVTIVEMAGNILPLLDREMTALVAKKLKSLGVDILTDGKVLSVDGSGAEASVSIEHGGEEKKISGEKVLVSVGRKINTDALGLELSGIENDRGRILVNEKMETNVAGVYAIGDCTGGSMLAHVASVHGEVAAENMMGHAALYDAKTTPSCVYTNPEFASVGLSEEQVKAKEIDYIVGKFPLMANGKTVVMGESGMVKIIAEKTSQKILGVHMVGPRATDLITEGALAIGMNARLSDLIDTIHAHPTIGEAMREAALVADGRPIHIPKR